MDYISRADAERQIIERASSEPDFRRRLIDDPSPTLSEHFGQELPDTVTFTILEQRPDQLYLVLPPPPERARELSDAELETVSGGLTAGCGEATFWVQTCYYWMGVCWL